MQWGWRRSCHCCLSLGLQICSVARFVSFTPSQWHSGHLPVYYVPSRSLINYGAGCLQERGSRILKNDSMTLAGPSFHAATRASKKPLNNVLKILQSCVEFSRISESPRTDNPMCLPPLHGEVTSLVSFQKVMIRASWGHKIQPPPPLDHQ